MYKDTENHYEGLFKETASEIETEFYNKIEITKAKITTLEKQMNESKRDILHLEDILRNLKDNQIDVSDLTKQKYEIKDKLDKFRFNQKEKQLIHKQEQLLQIRTISEDRRKSYQKKLEEILENISKEKNDSIDKKIRIETLLAKEELKLQTVTGKLM